MITVLLLAAPWLLALAWVLVRCGSGVGDSTPPSMADQARQRLATR